MCIFVADIMNLKTIICDNMEKNTMKRGLLLMALCCVGCLSTRAQAIILTSDQQLTDLADDPDKKIDNTTGLTKSFQSLREVVQSNKRNGNKEFALAFDEFFRQYRDDRNTTRLLTPDMDEYVEKVSRISKFVEKEGDGMGLELSLLSPLELGQAYHHQTGNTGHWVAFKVGRRNRTTGRFSMEMWQQVEWNNNKGKTPLKLVGVRAYAFHPQDVCEGKRYVDPNEIRPLQNVNYEVLDSLQGYPPHLLLRVYGEEPACQGYDHVMVILEYQSQEMDYFAQDALPFLKNLLKKYHDYGVNLMSLYSDEMHIQQDWAYFNHHEDGQLNVRYLTPSMQKFFQEKYGQPFDERYMLYFAYQPPHTPYVTAEIPVEYVMGREPVDVFRTALLRDRYYHLLQNTVVDLFKEAKQFGEQLFGRELRTSAHASWAQSPTIDYWYSLHPTYANNYEYTPNFLWSNTVHQAAAACYDYFKWGEYLQPTGNDFCEGGWLDRDYYGAAMAASIAVINKYPNAYAAAWGMPSASHERRMAINHAFGCQPPFHYQMVTGNVIRDIEVLMLYPMDLVAVNPSFGSWMMQYGYANYLTSDQLMKLGTLTQDGRMKVCEKQYGTIVVPFGPLPDEGLLQKLRSFAEAGGKVIWCSAPAILDKGGAECLSEWQNMFGVSYQPQVSIGTEQAGHRITFKGTFAQVPAQEILSNFLVDRVFSVEPAEGTEVVATLDGAVVGTVRQYPHGGLACFCGFRPRDDQSESLGYETRTLFEILNACGAYPGTGSFKGVNDNPTYLSRTTPYFFTVFPNGTTMVANHYRHHVENWEGGFSRNPEYDAQVLAANPLPSDTMRLQNQRVNGHVVTYQGRLTMGFGTHDGLLTTFLGQHCDGITLDGRKYSFGPQRITELTFAPVGDDLRHYRLRAYGQPEVWMPIPASVKSAKVTFLDEEIPAVVKKGRLVLTLEPRHYAQILDIRLGE